LYTVIVAVIFVGIVVGVSIPLTRRSAAPTENPVYVEYIPGLLVDSPKYPGLKLSTGLDCQQIAESGKLVKLNGRQNSYSKDYFHTRPDAAGVFLDPRRKNNGGWIYVSNSEGDSPEAGVGAITFDAQGNIIDYTRVIPNGVTSKNCGGGKTPWNTWISCEEHESGQCWQVDPTGERGYAETNLGGISGGHFESFAVDYRQPRSPIFFVTEDDTRGAVRRYIPDKEVVRESLALNDPWRMLHEPNGIIEYLVIQEGSETKSMEIIEIPNVNFTNNNIEVKTRNQENVKKVKMRSGQFYWSSNETLGRKSAEDYFPGSEGIDVVTDESDGSGVLYFVSKKNYRLFRLNLDSFEYVSTSTLNGSFDGQPDQIKNIVSDNGVLYTYFTEDGKKANGIHGRDKYHRVFTLLEGTDDSGAFSSETTGLAFSPDMRHMYAAFQENGVLFDCSRQDGLSFKGRTIDMRYHKK